jgi:hypothetical protein
LPGILVIGADNCAYYNKQKYRRVDETPMFIQTINWWEKFADKEPTAIFEPESNIWKSSFEVNAIPFR